MDQETKNTISKLQQAVWKLRDAQVLLTEVDSSIADDIRPLIEAAEMEMDELCNLESK